MTQNLTRLVALSFTLAAPLALAQEGVTDASAPAADTSVATRPEATALGFGLGWTLPGASSVFTPNTAAVRVRLGRLTLEPAFTLRGAGGTTRSDISTTLPSQPTTTVDDEDRGSGYELGLTLGARFDMLTRGPLDLVGIVGGRFGVASSRTQANVDQTDQLNERRESVTSGGLDWGLGVVWFLRHNLSLSADVTNPLLTYAVQRVEVDRDLQNGTQVRERAKTDQLSYGVTFNPALRVLFHLYF